MITKRCTADALSPEFQIGYQFSCMLFVYLHTSKAPTPSHKDMSG